MVLLQTAKIWSRSVSYRGPFLKGEMLPELGMISDTEIYWQLIVSSHFPWLFRSTPRAHTVLFLKTEALCETSLLENKDKTSTSSFIRGIDILITFKVWFVGHWLLDDDLIRIWASHRVSLSLSALVPALKTCHMHFCVFWFISLGVAMHGFVSSDQPITICNPVDWGTIRLQH